MAWLQTAGSCCACLPDMWQAEWHASVSGHALSSAAPPPLQQRTCMKQAVSARLVT